MVITPCGHEKFSRFCHSNAPYPGGTNLAAKSFEGFYDQTSSRLLKQTSKESFDSVKCCKRLM
jgi:hypothetical protein